MFHAIRLRVIVPGIGREPVSWALVTIGDHTVTARRGRPKAANTLLAYEKSWRRFADWCAAREMPPLPEHPGRLADHEALLADYIAEFAATRNADGTFRYARSTLDSWVAAVAHHFTEAGLAAPGRSAIVADALHVAAAERATAGIEPDRAAPLSAATLIQILESIHAGAVGWKARLAARRDAALLLTGYVGGLRRSELIALTPADIRRPQDADHDGLLLRVGGGQDPAGVAELVVGPGSGGLSCPCCAVLRWMVVVAAFDRAVLDAGAGPAAEIAVQRALRRDETLVELHICDREPPVFRRTTVPLFRPLDRDGLPHAKALSTRSVPLILKRRATEAGLDPETVEKLRGHSARAGAATQALANGVAPEAVARHLRARDPRSVLAYRSDRLRAGESVADRLGL